MVLLFVGLKPHANPVKRATTKTSATTKTNTGVSSLRFAPVEMTISEEVLQKALGYLGFWG